MKVYLVGGAVRDELLGLSVKERDWCVVGATPDELEQKGYRRVGKDFPVFLHPQTNEEYALARTERKTGSGYHGFQFDTSPNISIEDDLGRRDLTINAIARDLDGRIVDPYNGRADLEARLLRHVSDAFAEDPVRVLRVAKFAARFADAGFRVASETMARMREMVDAGEVDALVPDRVWKETEAALAGANPQVYFRLLRECGALKVVFPEIDALFGIPQPAKWHPEIDCGVHTMMVVEQAAILSQQVDVRFAALVHDLGKAATPEAQLPQHPGHEKRSVRLVKAFCKRLPVPAAHRDLGMLVAEFHAHCHRAFELKASTILRLLQRVDAFRRADRFDHFLLACEADARGRTGFETKDYPQARYLRDAYAAAASVEASRLARPDLSGQEIGALVSRARLEAISSFKKAAPQPPK
ncbi:MAG: multifunctional CCA addition/repair protein [Gammaproteobacteria bacterium]|nr:multifunctional CCA addition/repair protein [Gammaproteobacteria bacterium]